MLAQSTDSGANNNTMAVEMARIFEECADPVQWNAKANHVRCFAHKLALVVKAGLRSIKIDPGHTKPTTTPGREIPIPPLALDDTSPSNFPDDPNSTEMMDHLEDGEDVGGDRDGDTDSEGEGIDHIDSRLRQAISTNRWKPDVVVQGVHKARFFDFNSSIEASILIN